MDMDATNRLNAGLILKYIWDHGFEAKLTGNNTILIWDAWTYRDDAGNVHQAGEWREIKATIKDAREFLGY